MKTLLTAAFVLTCALAYAGTVTLPRWVVAAGDPAHAKTTEIYALLLFSGRDDPKAPEGAVFGAFADEQRCARAVEVMRSQSTTQRDDGKPPYICVPTQLVYYR